MSLGAFFRSFPEASRNLCSFPEASGTFRSFPEASRSLRTFPEASGSLRSFPDASRSFRTFPVAFGSHHSFPEASRSLRNFPEASSGSPRTLSEASRSLRAFPEASGSLRSFPEASGSFRTFPEASGSFRTFPEASRSLRSFPEASRSLFPEASGSFPEASGSLRSFPEASGGFRDVHVWCLFPEECADPPLLRACAAVLCAAERAHAAAAEGEGVRRERLLARALVRTTLARYCGPSVRPEDLRFRLNAHGKPQVVWPDHLPAASRPSLHFNLTHTRSLMACAVSSRGPVGLDCEEASRQLKGDPATFARRRFSEAEAAWVAEGACAEERRQRFVQLWTLKEAYVKAVGKGISACPLKSFSVGLEPMPSLRASLAMASGLPVSPEPLAISLALGKAMGGGGRGGGVEEGNVDPAEKWQLMLLQPSTEHYMTLCTSTCTAPDGSSVGGQSNPSTTPAKPHPLRASFWRTVPFVGDEPLEGACALGFTPEVSVTEAKEHPHKMGARGPDGQHLHSVNG